MRLNDWKCGGFVPSGENRRGKKPWRKRLRVMTQPSAPLLSLTRVWTEGGRSFLGCNKDAGVGFAIMDQKITTKAGAESSQMRSYT